MVVVDLCQHMKFDLEYGSTKLLELEGQAGTKEDQGNTENGHCYLRKKRTIVLPSSFKAMTHEDKWFSPSFLSHLWCLIC